MKKFAYFDSSHEFPEEIIMATDMIPIKLLGDEKFGTERGDQYLPAFVCANSRSVLHEVLENDDKWEGITLAHGCDVTNRQFDVWDMHVNNPFLYYLHSPQNMSKSAKKFYYKELEAYLQALEKHYNLKITNADLRQAIQLSNQIKKELQGLSRLREIKDIPNSDYFNLLKYTVKHPKRDVLTYLQEQNEEWQTRKEFPENKHPIFLTGSDINHSVWFDLLEKSHLRVVRDDLSLGERYYANLIPNTDDPVNDIISYYFEIPRSATKHPISPRFDFILGAIRDSTLEGVVSQNLKFCEVFAYDAPELVNLMRQKKIPIIHLEREYTPNVDNQILTRLEAFAELL